MKIGYVFWFNLTREKQTKGWTKTKDKKDKDNSHDILSKEFKVRIITLFIRKLTSVKSEY